jgi:hypothetical protein
VVKEGRFYRTDIPISNLSIVINRDIGLGISVLISLFPICLFNFGHIGLDISVTGTGF